MTITLISARIITVALTGFMLFLFFSPLYVSMFYLFFRPLLQPFAYQKFTIAADIPITSILAVVLILSAYFNGIFRRSNSLRNKTLVPLYIVIYFACMSFLSTPNYTASIGQLLKIVSAIAFYILVFNAVKSTRDINKILWAYLLSAILPMLFGYYQYITGTGHAWKGEFYIGDRIDSFLGEYNDYGEYLCITINAALMLFLREKEARLKQRVILIIIGSLALSLILSKNRGSWICLVAGFVGASV
jgi:hypothetical protein